MKWAILDSGASSHFLVSDAPNQSQVPAISPLKIHCPNGSIIESSHTCELDLPQLPKAARLAHVVPGLEGYPLVLVIKLCNAGCQVKITDVSCQVTYHGKTVVLCHKCTKTGLWMMPLSSLQNDQPIDNPAEMSMNEGIQPVALNAHKPLAHQLWKILPNIIINACSRLLFLPYYEL